MLRKGEECSDSIAKHSTCISYVSFMVYLTYDACTSCGIYKSNALVAVARTCRNHSSICAMDANILEMFRGHCFHSELLWLVRHVGSQGDLNGSDTHLIPFTSLNPYAIPGGLLWILWHGLAYVWNASGSSSKCQISAGWTFSVCPEPRPFPPSFAAS